MEVSTAAAAQPAHTLGGFADWLERDQSTEALTCDIEESAHRTASNGLREVTGPVLKHRSRCVVLICQAKVARLYTTLFVNRQTISRQGRPRQRFCFLRLL